MSQLFKIDETSDSSTTMYTWSDDIKQMLFYVSNELSTLKTQISNICPEEPYGITYLVDRKSKLNLSSSLQNVINRISSLLLKYNPNNGLVLLNNLTCSDFPAISLHALFALISDNMRDNNNYSLHSPISKKAIDTGFPVHADLFKARTLMNVITHVGTEKGGDITLLSRTELENAMNDILNFPFDVKNKILASLKFRNDKDAFNYTFDLMYGKHFWVSELIKNIELRQILIPSAEGIGYILNDGEWLHGRTVILGAVSAMRLQRLIFDNSEVQEVYDINKNINRHIQSIDRPNFEFDKSIYTKDHSTAASRAHKCLSSQTFNKALIHDSSVH